MRQLTRLLQAIQFAVNEPYPFYSTSFVFSIYSLCSLPVTAQTTYSRPTATRQGPCGGYRECFKTRNQSHTWAIGLRP